ncbi:protein WVD2-like 3 [Punica granatum]|uniref:Protein WVD2-like 3 n=1 Tax=Punica granatum TaxID=22663 RepID=A0A6P8BYQ9_PUNGR|nr:protein WVD2-like 3 [Punica granatum]
MGVEITDICVDKEQGRAEVYSNGSSDDPKPQEISDSYDDIKGDSECPASEECKEVKEYEVKECTNENPVKGEEEKTVESLKGKPKLDDKKQKDNSKTISSVKNGSKHSTGAARTKHTVPQPFALATAKRASSGARPTGTEIDSATVNNKSSSGKPVAKPSSKNANQSVSPPLARKPLQPDNKKHPDEEDSCSVDSSNTTSAQVPKSQMTVASAPTLRCTQRAEKRREFYSKLEQKQQALEAEKNQSDARTKRETEIKQLRKSMMFKATPMPSFYHEGPPPKAELKKMPPTRAKSPKLGRRKSSGDAVDPSQGEKVKAIYGRGSRFSLCDNAAQNVKHDEPRQMLNMEEPIPTELNGHEGIQVITIES